MYLRSFEGFGVGLLNRFLYIEQGSMVMSELDMNRKSMWTNLGIE